MNGYKGNPVKRLLCLALTACAAFSMSVTAFADEPYTTYNYDNWDDAIPSQTGYTVDRVVSGTEMGLKQLSDPSSPLFIGEKESASLNEARDIYNYKDQELWIADTTNNRVLCLDSDFRLKGCYKEAGGKSFKEPMGLFVTESPSTGKETVYIADSANERVVRATIESPTELERFAACPYEHFPLQTVSFYINQGYACSFRSVQGGRYLHGLLRREQS